MQIRAFTWARVDAGRFGAAARPLLHPHPAQRNHVIGTLPPKAELPIHTQGSLETELIVALARRNGVTLPYASVDALRAAYAFTCLQSLLDFYDAGAMCCCAKPISSTWLAPISRSRRRTGWCMPNRSSTRRPTPTGAWTSAC